MQQDSSDATKITYFTPRINGLMLGISFAPDTKGLGQLPDSSDDNSTDGEQYWGFGGSYKQKFDDFSVSIGAVGGISDAEDDSGREGIGSWALGALVGWGPFKLGGMYQDNGDGGSVSSVGDSTGFDVGIQYSQGPILVGLSWMHSELGAPFEDGKSGGAEADIVALGATYKLGKGVVVYAEGFWYTNEADDDSFTDDENESFGLILGTTVKF